MPVIENFEQITSRRIGQRRHCQVVHQEDIGLRPLGEQLRVTATTMGDGHLLVKFRHAQVTGREPLPTSLIDQRACKPTLPETGRRKENQVLPLPNPFIREQAGEQCTIQPACGAVPSDYKLDFIIAESVTTL